MEEVLTTQEQEQAQELNQDRAETNSNEASSQEKENEHSSSILTLLIFLPLAIICDAFGALDLTGFGAIIVRIVNFPILLMLWLWRTCKSGPKKNPTLQLLLTFLIEQSPFGIIPTWTISVLFFYFQDTKLGKKTIGKIKNSASAKK